MSDKYSTNIAQRRMERQRLELDFVDVNYMVEKMTQVILHEKSDFETRLVRSARRKKWLMANQTLLRTLLRFLIEGFVGF